MIKLVCVIDRPVGMVRDAFIDWWLNHHAKVAGRLPGLRRYTISVAQMASPDELPPFDGIAELWFDSREAMDAAFASEAGQLCAQEDHQLIGRRIACVTEEHAVV